MMNVRKMKIGILSSHPIQYQAPWFRKLAQQADIHVYFAHRATKQDQANAGFSIEFDWDVDLISGYPYTFLENISKNPGVNSFNGCNTPEISKIIQVGSYDAFVVNGWYLKSYIQAIWACHRYKVPVFIRGDSQLGTQKSFIKRAIKKVVYGYLFQYIDGFLSVGKRFHDYLNHYSVPDSKIFFVPHFVDNEWFSKQLEIVSPGKLISIKKEMGGEKLKLLFVGKFIHKKNPIDVINILSELRELGVDAVGVFVGDGELREEIIVKAKNLSVDVRMLGFKNQSELPVIYSVADLLILPSDAGETWGLVVNEALACGTPAVVSKSVGCVPDLIDEEITGTIFTAGDTKGGADAVHRMFLKANSQETVSAIQKKIQIYSVEKAVLGTLDALSLLNTQR